MMASDCDGKNSSLIILRSIREKLVEYKESLLRQLVDEREAALVAKEEDEAPESVKEIEFNSVGKKGSVLSIPQQEEDAAAKTRVKAEVLQPSANVGSCTPADSYGKRCATPDGSEKVIAEVTKESTISKKRRLAKVGMNGTSQAEEDGGSVRKAKRTKAKRQMLSENSNSPKKHIGGKERELKREVNVAELPEVVPLGTPYRVVRTSIPPTKYLVQKQRDEEASDREAIRQQQPVLLPSTASKNGCTGIKRSVPLSRSSPASVDTINAEFEQKLRESVSLYREVNKRSVNVTRKRQLPRLATPMRGKSHWDFLLEEMKWMATDFSQERNWKRVLQHRLAADVVIARNSGTVRREIENRQMARGIALQVSAFWRTMERIAARSRVRFEAAGTDSSAHGHSDDLASGGGHITHLEDDSKQEKSEDFDMVDIGDDTLALKYHTQDVAVSNAADSKSYGKVKARADPALASAKAHVSYIVSAGKRARSAMTSSSTECGDEDRSAAWSQREAAFRDLQARCTALQAKGGPTIILAAFQLLALRWMLDLYSSGLNMFLNDQLGMGKAATIVAFFSLIEIVSSQKQHQGDSVISPPIRDHLNAGRQQGPHLIVVSNEELHKWRHYLRIWHPDRRIQLYDGDQTSHYREKLQQEWKCKLSDPATNKGDDDFLVHDDDEGFDDDEHNEPMYCVLCPVDAFVQDRQAFVTFPYWQMVVVENDHGGHFDDLICVSALQQLRQQQRRILCNGQSIENWKNTALRLQYAEFLVCDVPALTTSDVCDSSQHRMKTWPMQELLVERSSVAKVMQSYGKSSSVRAALWKAASQKEDTPKFMNALLLALSCLSLRRVRNEVEQEFCKIEEISLSCQLSPSQNTQYRNALSGFAATLGRAGGHEDRLGAWLQLLLRLRQICNCVDLVNDLDKLGHADIRVLTSCSAKLEALEPLLRRLTLQEGKKVVIYCQFHAMFPVLELFLSLLDISYVHITGSIAMQRRALCHFAGRPVVRVALASTRLSTSCGGQAVSVFGSEAIIVVDGDWNATCDAKLRASWAKMAVGGAETLPVYRIHCESTVEASLLRVGASLTEKVFGEMTPQELLAVPSDMALTIVKPSWWSSITSNSSISGLAGTGAAVKLACVAQQVERTENYCGSPGELEAPLIVYDVDLDAEEHLLLANTDELTPVEWYAVNYVHGVTDKRQAQDEGKTVGENEFESTQDGEPFQDETNAGLVVDERSFEREACLEANRQWQQGDAASQLFYNFEAHDGPLNESALEKLFMQMRMQGMETHFDVYNPPQVQDSLDLVPSEASWSKDDTQMTFRISYRVPIHVPPTGKAKVDNVVEQQGDVSKPKSSKKQRNSSGNTARTGIPTTNSSANSAGVKRKLESQLGGIKSGPQKEQRVDLEGIPVPDISEFADDDFWGDTNLDALDSADWDDPALLGGILGGGVGVAVSGATSSTCIGAGASAASGVGTALGMAFEDSGHLKTGSHKNFKKSKSGTGRIRKSSMSSCDSSRDVWSVDDDIILKKLFELYGPNWTLIAQVFNSTTAVSRFVCKKRSPRQCYDRYGKIVSGTLATTSTSGASTVKDGKAGVSQKSMRVANVATAQLTPAMLDARIGLTQKESLVKFPQRDSLSGLPPPSIVSPPSLVSLMVAHRQQQVAADHAAAGKKVVAFSTAGGLDDLKSIKLSFDAIIQCMKHKTSPPPIPIPVGANATALGTNAAPAAPSLTTDFGTRNSRTAASAPSTPTKASALVPTKATVSPATTTKAIPVVPPPHKSHTDMISLLPGAVLGPDEVIKRSKEAAVVAVQAATAVASVGRDGSPLSASGDVMLGAGSGFGVSVSGSLPRRSHAASRTSDLSAVGVISNSTIPSPSPAANGGAASTAQPQTPTAATTAWGGMAQGVNANGFNATAPMDLATSASGNESQRNAPPMPVTTSTLLHVLDRMPEIKNKIQSILNRTDCSESQKVAMIARLLSNTNAIGNTNALGASAPMSSSDASDANSSSVLSALTADSGVLNSPDMLINSERAIPMPASLNGPPTSADTSAALTRQGQLQPPAK